MFSRDDDGDGRLVGVLDMEGADGAAALDQRDDRTLVGRAALPPLVKGRPLRCGDTRSARRFPQVGFVRLDKPPCRP